MNSSAKARNNFSPKPLAAAIALALVAPAAFADNGMPGAGLVVRNMGNITVNGIPLPGGNQIIGLISGATIQQTAAPPSNTVIQWGSPAVLDTANTAGFNIAAGKTLNFTSVVQAGIMNIDISGNLSKIDGKLVADANSYIVVANEKGITVGSAATITAPGGLSLIGASMNTIDAIDFFTTGGEQLMLNFPASAPVTVASGANLSGVGVALLVAGSGAVNVLTSKIPAAAVPIYVVGGVGSDMGFGGPPVANDKGAASVSVRQSAKTDVTLNLGATAVDVSANPLTVWANGDLTNAGNLDFKATPVTTAFKWTGKLTNSGTITTTTAATDINIDVDGTTVGWYNNGASLAKFAQGGLVNSGTISAPDGHINVELDGGPIDNSGTITALNYVDLESYGKGSVFTNSGTVTSTAGGIYVYMGDGDATNTGTMTADSDLYIEADSINPTNQHHVVNSGKLTSMTSYVSLLSDYGSVTNTATGVITGTSAYFWANYETGALPGHNTNAGTINITSAGGTVEFWNYGNGDIVVGGTIQATGAGNYIGYFSAAHSSSNDAKGIVKIDTPIAVMNDKGNTAVYLAGEKVFINAPITVTEASAGAGAGDFEVYGTNNTGSNSTHINADLVAGSFYFSTYNGGGAFGSPFDMTVMLDGDLTTTVGGTREIEFYDVASVIGPGVLTANHLVFDTSGSLRNPVSNNYLLNGLHITTEGTNPLIEVTARSPGVQTINLGITGDATLTSGQTVIVQQPCYSGLCISPSGGYIPQPNAGSSLLITATGNISVGANNSPGTFLGGGSGGLSATNGFLFPGAVVFVAGGALNVNTVVDNAFTGTAAPFQGIFFEGTTINATLPIYTNGNSFVNYSVRPNGGVGLSTVYNAKAGTNFLGFANLTATINPLGSFLNSYTLLENALANGEPWLPLVNTTPFTQ